MHSRNGLHQVGSRMVAKVRADIANTETSTTGLQIFRMLKSRFVKCIDLSNKQQCKNTTAAGSLTYNGGLILNHYKQPQIPLNSCPTLYTILSSLQATHSPPALTSKIYPLSCPSLTFPISLQTATAITSHLPTHHPQKWIKVYLLWSVRVPCPGKGFRGAQQWPCGSHERVDTACCGVGALKATCSYPAGQPQCSQASSSAHHNLSSHTQSGRVTGTTVL